MNSSKFELNPTPSAWSKNHPPTNGSPTKTLPSITTEENNDEEIIVIPPASKTLESYDSIAECFADASPNSDWEKALIVAAYLQVKNGLTDMTSFEVNKELKNLGHASSNITKAFDSNIDRKPQFNRQLPG